MRKKNLIFKMLTAAKLAGPVSLNGDFVHMNVSDDGRQINIGNHVLQLRSEELRIEFLKSIHSRGSISNFHLSWLKHNVPEAKVLLDRLRTKNHWRNYVASACLFWVLLMFFVLAAGEGIVDEKEEALDTSNDSPLDAAGRAVSKFSRLLRRS